MNQIIKYFPLFYHYKIEGKYNYYLNFFFNSCIINCNNNITKKFTYEIKDKEKMSSQKRRQIFQITKWRESERLFAAFLGQRVE